MTSVLADNVFNICHRGQLRRTPGDGQGPASPTSRSSAAPGLVAVNSINWARNHAQIGLLLAAGVALGAPIARSASACRRPTSANVFRRLIWRRAWGCRQAVHQSPPTPTTSCTAPCRQRLLQAGAQGDPGAVDGYRGVVQFERLLFEAYERDGEAVRQLLERFQAEPTRWLKAPLERLRSLFASHSVDDAPSSSVRERTTAPRSCSTAYRHRLSRRERRGPMPHADDHPGPAHPAKFAEAVVKAGFPGVPPAAAYGRPAGARRAL